MTTPLRSPGQSPTCVHHVAVSVADLDATATWYQEKLGCREEFRYEVPEMGMRAAFLAVGGLRVEVFEVPGSHPAGDDTQDPASRLKVRGLQHVALTVDDLDAACAELKDRGVRFVNDVTEVPDSGGARFRLFLDLDGVVLELFEPARPRQDLVSEPGNRDQSAEIDDRDGE